MSATPAKLKPGDLPGRAGRREGRQGMKSMKPCKAWAIARRKEGWMIADIWRVRREMPCLTTSERAVKVRIIEDAAVERAIECLRRIKPYAAASDWGEYEAAIRDLGGKP